MHQLSICEIQGCNLTQALCEGSLRRVYFTALQDVCSFRVVCCLYKTGSSLQAGDGVREEGWLYESPRHAVDARGGTLQSREGSVEDGELPRVPVQFTLSASKPGTPQGTQLATADSKRPASAADRGAPSAAAPPGEYKIALC